MRKSAYELMGPQIEKCLSETDRPQTLKEIAESLGVAKSSIYNVLPLMEVFKVVQRVRIAGRYRYFLKGAYDDERLSALFPPKKFKPNPRRRSILYSLKRSVSPVQESFLEEHLSTMRVQVSPGEGPTALAMIGLNQIDVVEDGTVPASEVVLRALDVDIEVEEHRAEIPKKIEPFDTVEHLPKDARKLNRMQTKHLKKQLKGLDGYDRIDSLKTAFADFSALKQGRYGTIFYFSMGTNPWERVFKVTVEDDLSLEMEEPIRGRKSKYDPIINRFLKSGHGLVEIDVEGKRPNYVQSQLKKRIEQRGLNILSSSSSGSVYLERKQ